MGNNKKKKIIKKNNKKKKIKKGFTLIELLAVIIILGILLLVAIPSVTTYINNSKKEAYITTAKECVKGAINLVNTGDLDIFDPDTTYYIPASCISTENNMTSPYGDFKKAYVVVGYNGNGFEYYWTSVDTANLGIEIKDYNKLTIDDIKSNMEDVDTNIGIKDKPTIKILDNEGCKSFGTPIEAAGHISEGGEITRPEKLYDEIVDNTTTNTNQISYRKISPYSDTDLNGQGIQVYDKNTYGVDSDGGSLPIYYYRGVITNNNVEFAGFCWKIFRTTSTGGIKMIYNGVYSDSNKCNNSGTSSTIGYCNLTDYTHLCEDKFMKYSYNSDGVEINSNMKTMVDNWYKNNLTNEVNASNINYTIYLEDPGFCNDMSRWYFARDDAYLSGSYYRNTFKYKPSLTCTNNEDLYTTSSRGNGKLTYPVGLITADEIALAGGVSGTKNTEFYLNTGVNYWTMSPNTYFRDNSQRNVTHYSATQGIYGQSMSSSDYLRPVVSLKPNIKFAEGSDGTANNPYRVITN